MPFKIYLFTLLFLHLSSISQLHGQTETDPEIADIIESLDQNPDEAIDYSGLLERLTYYKKNPLNLNSATESDFKDLWLLSPLQITSLLSHRAQNGPLLDLLELQGIAHFDLKTIQRILPLIKLGIDNPFRDFKLKQLLTAKHDLMFRLQQGLERQAGFSISDTGQSRYLGSPQKMLLRYRYHYDRHLSLALNLEKDAGEQFFKGNSFDFSSGHIAFKDIGPIKKLVLGDYDLQFGQGLGLWSGLSFGKGALISAIAKQDVGLKPYSSLNEGLFFRGLAFNLQLKSFQITPFFSYRKLDASLSDEMEVSSINISGFHRTPTELANKNNLNQLVYGANGQWQYRNLNLGLTAYHTQFNRTFEAGKYPYNQFEFADKQLNNYSLSYNYTFRNTYFFGEIAQSSGSNLAMVNGLLSSLSPQVSLGLLYRNYPKNYHSFYNTALAEAGNAVKEGGFYTGITLKPTAKWEWSTYADVFRFPWLKYGVDAPSNGFECFSQLIFKPNKRMQITGLYRIESKEHNDDDENTINYLIRQKHQKFRFDLSYMATKSIQIRNRIEMVQFQSETAYLLFQDVIYKPLSSKFSGNIRLAVFNTPGYDSRIYAFQNDVLYSYSILAYQNKGLQFYFNGRYTLKRGLDFWLHYQIQAYRNQESTGSGLSQTAGNKRSEIKLQLRYQF